MTQRPFVENALQLPVDGVQLAGDLLQPPGAAGLVVFVHGSGSSRRSPRNQQVAQYFAGRGLATLLFDLLTADEHAADQITRHWRFDIPLLSRRLVEVLYWVGNRPDLKALPIGLFGASTGAAAALMAAAQRPDSVHAVVSRGGRTDLALQALERVRAPTLQIVGAHDTVVLDLNQDVASRLSCPNQLTVIPGATHLFDEPGTLDQAAEVAADWFLLYLPAAAQSPAATVTRR